MPDLTDKAAQAYADAFQSAIDDVISRYPALANRPQIEATALLNNIDMDALMRGSFGMEEALEKVSMSFAHQIVVVPPPPVTPSAETISAMLKFEVESLSSQMTQTSSEIKKIMMRSVLGHQSEAEFAAALETGTLKASQVNSYVNQNLRSFHRTVESQMAEANPEALYIWAGPLDDRTSDDCIAMISLGALNQSEWQSSGYGQFLNSGTHYGCRHTLQQFVQVSQLENTKEARDE